MQFYEAKISAADWVLLDREPKSFCCLPVPKSARIKLAAQGCGLAELLHGGSFSQRQMVFCSDVR